MKEDEIDTQLEELHTQDETKGERYYARKFKSAYIRIRKGLVILAKNRKELGSQRAVEKANELLETVLEDLN